MSNFDRLNATRLYCETREDGLYVVRDGDWEINVTQLKVQHDDARAEAEQLRRQNALLGQAMWKWEQRVGAENLPAIGAEATLAYDEALGRVR